MDLRQILKDEAGYMVFEKLIPEKLIDSAVEKFTDLYPVRASSSKKRYAERDKIKELEDISVWWSQLVGEREEVKAIQTYVDHYASQILKDPVMYASDVVFIEANSVWVNPHVDTPYRFNKWNFDQELWGIQSIVSLSDIGKDNAATGLVPFSQKKDFPIMMCYGGYYDHFFKKNHIQPEMPKGSLLIYNSRVLHSSMPNPRDTSRPALLFNYVERCIIDELKIVDNIWNSNGK